MARREPLLVRVTKWMGTFVASSLIAAWLTLCVMRAVFIPTVDAKMTLFPSSGKIGKKVHPGPHVKSPMAPTPAPDDGVSWDDQTARARAAEDVRAMFHHAYDNYMTHAFPHDELKPLSRTWTDSLGELGNLDMKHLPEDYAGVALTLIDATSTVPPRGVDPSKRLLALEQLADTLSEEESQVLIRSVARRRAALSASAEL